MAFSDSECSPNMLLKAPSRVFRGVVDNKDGNWFTDTHHTAELYGQVAEFQVRTPLPKILNLGDHRVVEGLAALFARYAEEVKPQWSAVFKSVFRTREDGLTERDSDFLNDTIVVNALHYAYEQGWLDSAVDGIGAGELHTDSGSMHHPEIYLFQPAAWVTLLQTTPCSPTKIADLRLKRKTGIEKRDRKTKKKKRTAGRTVKSLAF